MYPLTNGIYAQVVTGRGDLTGNVCVDIRKHSVSRQTLIPGDIGIAIPFGVWEEIIKNFEAIEKEFEKDTTKVDFRKDFESVSKTIVVSVDYYKGKKYLDIREYYTSQGRILPTTKGCKLPKDGFIKLQKILRQLTKDRGVFKFFDTNNER